VVQTPERPAGEQPVRGWRRWSNRQRALTVLAVLAGMAFLYFVICFVQVWQAARRDEARPAEAIVVLGAAQYDGVPSPVLAARLDHALELWEDGLAPYIVVTGGKQEGDRFTEATAAANYLIERGVPDEAILREVDGTSTWESLAASARFLRDRGLDDVLIVSDPYHVLRSVETARELGLDARGSPADSPVTGWTEKQKMVKEAAGVALGRVIGYRRLLSISG
jgi:uncharacterized SAM-binding protein YcdF (DUF218 family)